MVINDEEQFVILKKLEVPRIGQIHCKLNEPDSQDGVIGR